MAGKAPRLGNGVCLWPAVSEPKTNKRSGSPTRRPYGERFKKSVKAAKRQVKSRAVPKVLASFREPVYCLVQVA